MKTFLFYDIETTGLNKAFDQIIQFAAIRTDMALQEIARYEFRVRLNPDMIPSPKALLTHKISIQHMRTEGLSEYEAMQKIHHLLNTPGTISLGYNSLGFDDEFLRFGFYRHLLSPYTHQFAQQCGRMDMYPSIILFYLFKNDLLIWPTKEDGSVSLKLEDLNTANQLATGPAHDAMNDVVATLALARHLAKEEILWHYLQGYFQKNSDNERIQKIQAPWALMIRNRLGAKDFFHCPVMLLGQHRHYKNQSVWLRLDSQTLQNVTPDTIKENTFSFYKKLGEPDFILPPAERFLQHLNAERLALTETNYTWLMAHKDLLQAITDWHLNYQYPFFPETDAEARLYLDGFRSAQEENFCRQFHAASPMEKAALTLKAPTSTTKTLAIRLLKRHFISTLPPELAAAIREISQENDTKQNITTPIDYQGNKRLTPDVALATIQTLRAEKSYNAIDHTLLDDYENYLRTHFTHTELVTSGSPCFLA